MLPAIRTARVPLPARGAVILLALLTGALGLWRLTAARADHVSAWPHGDVRYFDATGMVRTVDTAAARWNASGARVHLSRVARPADADVVIRIDDRKLRGLCGDECLGYSSSIGRGGNGPGEVLLAGDLGHTPR